MSVIYAQIVVVFCYQTSMLFVTYKEFFVANNLYILYIQLHHVLIRSHHLGSYDCHHGHDQRPRHYSITKRSHHVTVVRLSIYTHHTSMMDLCHLVSHLPMNQSDCSTSCVVSDQSISSHHPSIYHIMYM